MKQTYIKVIHLAHRLHTSPRSLSDTAYELRIKKWHNEWGEEFFRRRDAKNIIKFYRKAEQMQVSPFFLLAVYQKRNKSNSYQI